MTEQQIGSPLFWSVHVSTDYGVWTMLEEDEETDPARLDRYQDSYLIELHDEGLIGSVSLYVLGLDYLVTEEPTQALDILDEDAFAAELSPLLVGKTGFRSHAKHHETLARFSGLRVDPEYRRRGAGRILLEAARRKVPSSALMAVIPSPIPDDHNPPLSEDDLRAWYSRLGFSPDRGGSGFMLAVNDLKLPSWFPPIHEPG